MDSQTEQQPATKPIRVRCAVSPEIASNVREEGEAVAATINASQRVATATIAAAKSAAESAVAGAIAQREAAFRPILRQLGYDDERASIVATEGFGVDTVLVIELTPPDPAAAEVPNA